jgi:hypothetical protein
MFLSRYYSGVSLGSDKPMTVLRLELRIQGLRLRPRGSWNPESEVRSGKVRNRVQESKPGEGNELKVPRLA